MNFINQFIPVSKLSYLSIGYLFFYAVPNNLLDWKIQFLFVVSFCWSIFTGYSKLSAILIGILISILQNVYFNQQIPASNLKEHDLTFLKNKKVEIHYIKEVKRNFYETEIYFEDIRFTSITKRYKKDITLPILLCDSSLISLKKISPDLEYFRFLRAYHFQYLQLPEYKCKRISENIDSKKLFRKNVEDILTRSSITDSANDIAMGLFFGDASYLETEFKEKVREGGVLHLFAASGLHIGVFIAFLYFFAKRILFLNYYTEKIIPLLIAFSYLYLLDFPVSLLRAYIFTSVLVVASLFFRKMKSIDLIITSSAFILLLDRDNFLTLSFTLSYSAVCGILFLKQFLDKLLFGKWKNFFTENFTISISASLGTYPVLLFYFKTFSFGSIFLNLLLVPLTSLLLPLLYISLSLQYTFEFLFSGALDLVFWKSAHNFCSIGIFQDWFWHFWKYLTEILWTYSELLLRTLAFLSERLSETVGFYRGVKDSFSFHIGIYYGLMLFLCICFIGLDFKFFQEMESSKRTKRIRIFLSMLSCLTIGFFFYFGYVLFPETKQAKAYSKNISAGSDYYLVKEGNSIYLGGICKYSQFQIQKILKQDFCDFETASIFIEEESCLSLANLCKKDTPGARIYTSKKMHDWEKVYSYMEHNASAFKRKFSNLLVFYPHIDSLYELQRNARTEKGNILLLFAYKLQDSAKVWNENKNVLGINPNWNFITPDEL